MTDQEEKIIAALDEGQATPEQQKEAARIIRDLDRELREISEWGQRD
jgi:predicted RNA-binding protein associated with RNAse of E/G family